MVTAAEIAAVDAFLADQKTLYGAPPEFGPTNFHRRREAEWQAIWPIANSAGAAEAGQLRFVARSYGMFSISVIFRSHNIMRLDFESMDVCELNPFWAVPLGVDARVCGPHLHAWEANKSHVLTGGVWDLPVREALPTQVRRFGQALPWLADRMNLMLTPEQRMFELPATLV